MNRSPRSASITSSILRCGVVFLLVASIAAQSRIIRPSQTNTNSAKRPHVATLRASDSPEGSRVAISSDQSLNNYEAYRRGDRFYVKIPAADVPRAEAVRGRGFADVKAQRAGDSTVVSFRLQPGATAHVEQRANKLDVVVSVPGGGATAVASNRTRESTRPSTSNDSNRTEANKRGTTPASSTKTTNANKANANRSSMAPALSNSNSNKSVTAAATPARATPTPLPTPSPKASPSPKPTGSPGQKGSINQAGNSPSPSPTNPSTPAQGDFWARARERAHYWILLAQLNPIPVALGAMLLVLFIGLLLFQRRRARATRRVKSTEVKKETAPVATSVAAVEASSADDAGAGDSVTSDSAAAAPDSLSEVAPIAAAVVPAAVASTSEDGRKERVSRATEEARKVFAGESYDESVIGSDDRETRRLVGAELASALVGRNPEKRERALATFMKHGYFDDATRDLRVAESANERAAAARRLSFVNDREATPHLIGALGDSAPDVRRAAIEALMDLRDPAAIAPLNSLLQTETDRKVPRNLIQNAIDACATAAPAETSAQAESLVPVEPAAPAIAQSPAPVESEREVIEL